MTPAELQRIPWKDWPQVEKNKARGWVWIDGVTYLVDPETGEPLLHKGATAVETSTEKWREKPPPGEVKRLPRKTEDCPLDRNGIPVLDEPRAAGSGKRQERRNGRRPGNSSGRRGHG